MINKLVVSLLNSALVPTSLQSLLAGALGGTTEYLSSGVAVALIIETKEALRSRGNATIGEYKTLFV